MYNYQIDEEEIKKLIKEQGLDEKKITSEEDLLKAFDKIDEDYSLELSGNYNVITPELTKLENSEFNEEEAKKSAENFYAEEILNGKNLIEENAQNETVALNNSKDALKSATENSKAELEEIFSNRKKEAESDAIKRGLARSSIIINKIEAFDKAKIDEYSKLNQTLNNETAKIESQIELLEAQKQNALKNFDLSYAIKINEKIDSLKSEHAKKQEEILKYNNEIALKEAEFMSKQNQNASDYENDAFSRQMDILNAVNKYGADVVFEKQYNAKYEILLSYLQTLPKKEAVKIAQNKTYMDAIGTKNYLKLLTEISK